MIAHRFQEAYTGCQMYIWHCETEQKAKERFQEIVINPHDWQYLGIIKI